MFGEFDNIDEFLEVADKEALFNFGEKYLGDAMRVVATRLLLQSDQEMLYSALTLLVAIYMRKARNNEFDDISRIH